MDRLKLETVYLRALDALMSADEYQIQAAIFRLRRAQARLHGWEVQRSPTIHSHTPPSRFTYHRTLCVPLRQPKGMKTERSPGPLSSFRGRGSIGSIYVFSRNPVRYRRVPRTRRESRIGD
jgi:hypothetical protein